MINIKLCLKVLNSDTELCLFMPFLSDLDCVSWSQQHLSVAKFQSSMNLSNFLIQFRLSFMWFVTYAN